MIGFIKNLFKTEKTTNTIVQGVRDGLDAIWYTKEEEVRDEKALANIRNDATKLWLEALKVDADSSSIRSVTRRWISLFTIGHYFIWIDLALIAQAFASVTEVEGKAVVASAFADYAWTVVLEVYWLVFAVASYYFGPSLVERIVGATKGRKNDPSRSS